MYSYDEELMVLESMNAAREFASSHMLASESQLSTNELLRQIQYRDTIAKVKRDSKQREDEHRKYLDGYYQKSDERIKSAHERSKKSNTGLNDAKSDYERALSRARAAGMR